MVSLGALGAVGAASPAPQPPSGFRVTILPGGGLQDAGRRSQSARSLPVPLNGTWGLPPTQVLVSVGSSSRRLTAGAIVGVAVGALVGLLLLLCLIDAVLRVLALRRLKLYKEDDVAIGKQSLGTGGQGTVIEGTLQPGGVPVAVKQAKVCSSCVVVTTLTRPWA